MRRRAVLAAALALAAGACAGSPPPAPVAPTTAAPSAAGRSASPAPSVAPATPSPSPSASPSPSPRPTGIPASLAGTEWTRLPTDRALVALTFDAGGDTAGVRKILDALAAADARATFFLTGRWAEVSAGPAREIAARHEVGNHTYSHPQLTTLDDAAVRLEIERGAAAIRSVTGAETRPLFRFPYGDRDARTIGLANALGYGGVRWTVDTLGWMGGGEGRSVASVTARVLGALGPGEIVLMHVGAATDRSTLDADALPGILATLRERGYTTVRVGDLIAR